MPPVATIGVFFLLQGREQWPRDKVVSGVGEVKKNESSPKGKQDIGLNGVD